MLETIIFAALAVYCGWVIIKKSRDIKAGRCSCGCGGACQGCKSLKEKKIYNSSENKKGNSE